MNEKDNNGDSEIIITPPILSTPSIVCEAAQTQTILKVAGNWTIKYLNEVEEAIENLQTEFFNGGQDASNKDAQKGIRPKLIFDFAALGEIDTNGAYLLNKMVRSGDMVSPWGQVEMIGEHASAPRLMAEISRHMNYEHKEQKSISAIDSMKFKLAAAIEDIVEEVISSISFIGQTVLALVKAVLNPGHIRWTPVFSVAESAGLNAIPIVILLTFFIGVVITFIAAQTLATLGASVFTVDLLGIAVLREFAALITAIIISGRSASAFTAQIGSMKMTQEIDAMSIIGLDPMEMLVIPRVLALLAMMPILVFFSMIAGLVGGGLIAGMTLDMSLSMFLSRLQEHVGITHFWVGMSKTPAFAIAIAIIGCRQGLKVENDVISLGKHTTAAVVQAIFMVIVLEAVFALIYYELDI